MKNCIAFVILIVNTFYAKSQAILNTFYINQSGEKVLRLEAVLPVDITTARKLFTTDEKLKNWIAPVAHIQLKTGGYIITNYDTAKSLTGSSCIKLPILSFIDKELLVFRVNLNGNFAQSVRNEDGQLQEIIHFKETGKNKTKIISSMTGWGTGNDWDKTYYFFAKGNEWTYRELLKQYH